MKTHSLKFWVTRTQKEKIQLDAQTNGYVCISAYIRDLALQHNDTIQLKILEMNKNVKRILEAIE